MELYIKPGFDFKQPPIRLVVTTIIRLSLSAGSHYARPGAVYHTNMWLNHPKYGLKEFCVY